MSEASALRPGRRLELGSCAGVADVPVLRMPSVVTRWCGPAGLLVPRGPASIVATMSHDPATLDSGGAHLRRPRGAIGAVLGALRPSLRHLRVQLGVTVAVLTIAVGIGAAIPRLVKELLHHGGSATVLVLFIAFLVADPFINNIGHIRAAKVSLHAGLDLRNRVFVGLQESRTGQADASVRANAIANTGADVDRVEHGFEMLLIGGIPGVLRIAAALFFLSTYSPFASALMALLVPLYFVVQASLSGRLVKADAARHSGADRVATVVDESLTASSAIRGLAVGTWIRRRFAHEAHHLDELTLVELRLDARLHFATRVVALAGLAGVTILGMRNEASAGQVLSALLYIELAMLGLEALPPTIRALQQGESSVGRLQDLLDAANRDQADVDRATGVTAGHGPAGSPLMELRSPDGTVLSVPGGAWVVVVEANGIDAPRWLGGLTDPPAGSVLVGGLPAPLALRSRRLAAVTADARCVEASTLDHLRAVDPELDEASAAALLGRLEVAHLADLPGGGLHASLGVQGSLLSNGERHRLLLAMAIAGRAEVLVTGRLRPLMDPEVARPVVAELRRDGAALLTATDSEELASSADLVLFIDADRWHLATHHDLLVDVPSYVEQWKHAADDITNVGALKDAGPLEREALRTRMVTERYEPGETIYREGAPADRMVFVVSGRVEVLVGAGSESERRLAVIGPGNACGDLRLTPDERRAETARAIDLVVVRTIGRAVWEAGLGGILHSDPTERRVLATVLRRGNLSADELVEHLPDSNEADVRAAIGTLLRDGALRQQPTGELMIGSGHRRSVTSARAGSLLDSLTESQS